MSKRSATLLAEAMKLSAKERATLVRGILESLGADRPDVDSMSEEDFTKEMDRRHREILCDPSAGIPMDEVKRLTRIK